MSILPYEKFLLELIEFRIADKEFKASPKFVDVSVKLHCSYAFLNTV